MKNLAKSCKTLKYDEYESDEDFEESDKADEDDPDDVDFEPDFGDADNRTKNKAKMLESSFDEDDDDEDNDLDLSDEEELEYSDRQQRRKRRKVGCKPKSTKYNKSSMHSWQKRGRVFSDDEESFENFSEQDFDEEVGCKTRKPLQMRKKTSARSTGSVHINSHTSELHTSGRSVRKVSYVESDESEEAGEDKSAKSQKALHNDFDEDDGDSIERVLWHQPKGMAEGVIRNKSAQPSVLSTLSDSELEWYDVEFYVKCKGRSYLHCQWKSYSDLQNLTGFKKVLNYIKRASKERRYKSALSREEVEVHDVSKKMELDLLKQ